MADFASLDLCKQRLRVTGTDDDDELRGVMAAATSAAIGWMNRDPRVNEFEETFNGDGSDSLILRQYPILEVTQVSFGGASLAPSEFTWDAHSLVLLGKRFPRGRRNVTVIYSAGLDPAPKDLREGYFAVLKAFWMARGDNPNTLSENTGGILSESWHQDGPGSVPPAAKALLRRFQNPTYVS